MGGEVHSGIDGNQWQTGSCSGKESNAVLISGSRNNYMSSRVVSKSRRVDGVIFLWYGDVRMED